MKSLETHSVQQDSMRQSADAGHLNRYGEAINRYLGAAGYRAEEAVSAPIRPTVPPGTTTGVVLVGADETPVSYTAVDHAAIEAELRGWALRIVHVQRAGGLRPPSRDAGAQLLQRFTERVHACSPSLVVTSTLAVGSAPQLLLAEAATATLVVVGHRHGTAYTAVGLSVGERVAAQHTGPVLVVRIPGWPPGPGFGERPIVVGADQPGLLTPVAGFALAEARARGCELVLLHADPSAAPADRLEMVEGVRVHHRTIDADPQAALTDASNRAAALVLGRHSVAGSPVTLLGSVSRTLLQHAYCPIFLVG
ncbi:universal stress protein [Actinoplanes sp. NPDC049118]|uniref:universal stress protein n=1 Tax=Actinoplanes sp. NPDC049118 TaxID=3155769 RepID=UPI003406EFCD